MDDDAEVVLADTAAQAGTYRKDVFMRDVAVPLMARFTPTLRKLRASGSTAVAQADAVGHARSPAQCAELRLRVRTSRGRIARVTEYLDMAAFEAIWTSIDAASPREADHLLERTV